MAGAAYLAAAYAAGVYLSPKLNIASVLIFAAVYFVICLVRRIFRRGFGFMSAAVIAMFCVGIILSHYYSAPSMRDVSRYDGMYVTLTGRICEVPQTEGDNNRYTVDVRRVSVNGKTENVRERMLITSPESYNFGDTVDFSGFVREINDKMNENGFDLKRHYKSKDIFYRCYAPVSQPSDMKIVSHTVYSYASRLRNSISQILDKYTYDDRGSILKAIIIGSRTVYSEDFAIVLNRTGTTRFLYPAFMHIMLLVGLVGLFSGITKKKYRDIALILLLIIYAMAESTRPVIVKGCLVMIFLIIFRRRLGYIYFADVLGAVVLMVGISNPLMFYNAGFVTSVTASLLISLFYAPVSKRIKIKNKYVRRTFTIGIICVVGLLPLSALFFNGISIYIIVTALIFLPATFVILMLSPLLLAMLALFGTAPIVGELVTAVIWIYMKLPYLIDALPYSHIALPKVGVLTIIAFYTAVYGVYLLYKEKKYNGFLALCVSASFFAVVLSGQIPRLNTAEFTFVNVGQGDGALVQIPYRNTVLIDGGGGNEFTEYNPGESIYLPYLASLGISRADCAIVSHCHSDHAEGIIAAIKNINVRHLYLPTTQADNEIYKELMLAAHKNGTQVHVVNEPTVLNFNSGLKITMCPPGKNALLGEDENEKSLLIRVSYGDADCYFTGDMPKAEEYGLVAEGKVAPAEILKVAHHGSDTSTSKIFLEAVKPDYAVISVGEDNGYGLPSGAVIRRLGGTSILRTDKNGDIKIIADKNGKLKIKTYK